MTLAVTGGTGFVGQALVAEALRRGHRVKILARTPTTAHRLWADAVTVCEGDLLDTASVARFLSAGDVVVNLAYLKTGPEDNEAAARTLASTSKASGVARIVHCSTAVVVGPKARGVITERTPERPLGEYEETKLRVERVLATESDRVPVFILRPTEVFGPGGQGLKSLIARVRDGGSGRFGHRVLLGNRPLHYVCLENVVEALLRLCVSPVETESANVYLVSDDHDSDNNYRTLEHIIAEVLGRRSFRALPAMPVWGLSAIMGLLPGHTPIGRRFACTKLAEIGYRPVSNVGEAVARLAATEARE